MPRSRQSPPAGTMPEWEHRPSWTHNTYRYFRPAGSPDCPRSFRYCRSGRMHCRRWWRAWSCPLPLRLPAKSVPVSAPQDLPVVQASGCPHPRWWLSDTTTNRRCRQQYGTIPLYCFCYHSAATSGPSRSGTAVPIGHCPGRRACMPWLTTAHPRWH